MAAAGVAVALIVGFTASWLYATVAGWCAASLVFITTVWVSIGRLDATDTRTHATREDPGRVVSDVVIVGAALASIVALVLLVLDARHETGAAKLIAAALAFASVALSWTLIHTLYTLRYARLYYAAGIGGQTGARSGAGINFNTDEPPRYTDFAYLAFDLGMTYQVSDTSLRTSALRAVVLRHTLLSYAFGTLVLASTVNLVLGL